MADDKKKVSKAPEKPSESKDIVTVVTDRVQKFMKDGLESALGQFEEGSFMKKVVIGGVLSLGDYVVKEVGSVLRSAIDGIFETGSWISEKLSSLRNTTGEGIFKIFLGEEKGKLLWKEVGDQIGLTEIAEAWAKDGSVGVGKLIYKKYSEGLVKLKDKSFKKLADQFGWEKEQNKENKDIGEFIEVNGETIEIVSFEEATKNYWKDFKRACVPITTFAKTYQTQLTAGAISMGIRSPGLLMKGLSISKDSLDAFLSVAKFAGRHWIVSIMAFHGFLIFEKEARVPRDMKNLRKYLKAKSKAWGEYLEERGLDNIPEEHLQKFEDLIHGRVPEEEIKTECSRFSDKVMKGLNEFLEVTPREKIHHENLKGLGIFREQVFASEDTDNDRALMQALDVLMARLKKGPEEYLLPKDMESLKPIAEKAGYKILSSDGYVLWALMNQDKTVDQSDYRTLAIDPELPGPQQYIRAQRFIVNPESMWETGSAAFISRPTEQLRATSAEVMKQLQRGDMMAIFTDGLWVLYDSVASRYYRIPADFGSDFTKTLTTGNLHCREFLMSTGEAMLPVAVAGAVKSLVTLKNPFRYGFLQPILDTATYPLDSVKVFGQHIFRPFARGYRFSSVPNPTRYQKFYSGCQEVLGNAATRLTQDPKTAWNKVLFQMSKFTASKEVSRVRGNLYVLNRALQDALNAQLGLNSEKIQKSLDAIREVLDSHPDFKYLAEKVRVTDVQTRDVMSVIELLKEEIHAQSALLDQGAGQTLKRILSGRDLLKTISQAEQADNADDLKKALAQVKQLFESYDNEFLKKYASIMDDADTPLSSTKELLKNLLHSEDAVVQQAYALRESTLSRWSKALSESRVLKVGGITLSVLGTVTSGWEAIAAFHEAGTTDVQGRSSIQVGKGTLWTANFAADLAATGSLGYSLSTGVAIAETGALGTIGSFALPLIPVTAVGVNIFDSLYERTLTTQEWQQKGTTDQLLHEWITSIAEVESAGEKFRAFFTTADTNSIVAEKRETAGKIMRALILMEEGKGPEEVPDPYRMFFLDSILDSSRPAHVGQARDLFRQAALYSEIMMTRRKMLQAGETSYVIKGMNLLEAKYDMPDFDSLAEIMKAFSDHALEQMGKEFEKKCAQFSDRFLIDLYCHTNFLVKSQAEKVSEDIVTLSLHLRSYLFHVRNVRPDQEYRSWVFEYIQSKPSQEQTEEFMRKTLEKVHEFQVSPQKSFETDVQPKNKAVQAVYQMAKFYGYSGSPSEEGLRKFFSKETAGIHGLYWDGAWYMNDAHGLDETMGESITPDTLKNIIHEYKNDWSDIFETRNESLYDRFTIAQKNSFRDQALALTRILEEGAYLSLPSASKLR